jgi:hypothetical protein
MLDSCVSSYDRSDGCDLDSVMLEALKQDFPDIVSELLRRGLLMQEVYAKA